jgi:hypothetical protein
MVISQGNTLKGITIIHLAGEEGGTLILGKKSEGQWVFLSEENAYDCDDDTLNAHETLKSTSLADLLPSYWLMMHPIEIHKEFIPWFHNHYLQSLEAMDTYNRSMYDWQLQDRWEAALSLKGI